MRLSHYFGLAIVFFVSRAIYQAAGVTFDASPLDNFLQFIDLPLLQSRFFESILYLHMSPPLLNIIAGAGLMLPGENAVVLYALVFHLVGYLLLVSTFYLVARLTGSQVFGWLIVAFLAMTPSFILYENWLMYTFLASGLLTMSSALLLKYLDSHSAFWGFMFFLSIAVLALTRSIFHFYWVLLIVVVLVLVSQIPKRQVLVSAAIPLILVFGWYAKNLYLVDSFTASTLSGLSLNNVTTLTVSKADLEPLVDEEVLSHFALVSRYRELGKYLDANRQAPTGIAVLDENRKSNGKVNFNSLGMKRASDAYLEDGVAVLVRFPRHYLRAIGTAHQVYFTPASFQPYFSGKNLAAIGPIAEKFDRFVYGASSSSKQPQPHFGYGNEWFVFTNVGYILVVLSAMVFVYGAWQATRTVRLADWTPGNIVVGYMFGCWLLVYVAGAFFELSENNRYRFIAEPLFWILVTIAVRDLYARLTSRPVIDEAAASSP